MDVRSITCLVPLLAGGTVLAQGSAGGEGVFSHALERAEEDMRKGQWEKAYEALRAAVTDHEGQAYVRLRRPEIENDIRKCAFWMEHDEPHPKKLVSGKLTSYSRSTGLLRIVYEPDTVGDFHARDEALFHPASFEGNHTIEIEGDAYDPGLGLLVCADPTLPPLSYYIVLPGVRARVGGSNRHVALVARVSDSRQSSSLYEGDVVDQNLDSPTTEGEAFRIRVTVADRSIKVSFKGKTILKVTKEPEQFGHFAVFLADSSSKPRFEKLTVKGRAPAWIQGLQDAAVRDEWEAFEKTFRIDKHLPEWLVAELEETESNNLEILGVVPGPYFDGQEDLIEKAHRFLSSGELAEGLAFVEGLDAANSSPEFRLYVEALFRCEMGEFDEAAKRCEQLEGLVSEFNVAFALLQARVKGGKGETAEAIAEYRELLEEIPGLGDAHGELATLLLWEGRVDEVREIVRTAVAAGCKGEALDRVAATLAKCDNGPDWDKTYEYVSEHYRIRSDIDRTVCYEASKILESSFNLYRRTLGRAEEPAEPLSVFLFSGEAGYKAYAEDVAGRMPGSTAGVYMPALKQLLIWNLPSREQMMRTVRHEGLHQYLDHLLEAVPHWFNEGLAEYFENADRNGTKWILGEAHRRHMIMLKASRREDELVPLKEFLYQNPRDFMSNGGLHYAQGWAFINYLRHSTEENEAIFDELLTAFGEEEEWKAAVDRAFRDVNLERMEEDFLVHVFRWE